MSVTRTQAIANVREMMDATGSARWTDAFITTVLGIVGMREWAGILNANPYYRFASRAVTTDANGQFLYTALNSGSADTAQNWFKVLVLTDGNVVYRQVNFADNPLATTSNYASTSYRQWYEAGLNVQVLPVTSGLALTAWVNYTPTRIDSLTGGSVVIDFPEGNESILWLETAAELLNKGGAETDDASTMHSSAALQRQTMYAEIARRSTRMQFLGFNDSARDWAG